MMMIEAPESPVTANYPLSLCEVCHRPYIKRTDIQALCHIACYVVQQRRRGRKYGYRKHEAA